MGCIWDIPFHQKLLSARWLFGFAMGCYQPSLILRVNNVMVVNSLYRLSNKGEETQGIQFSLRGWMWLSSKDELNHQIIKKYWILFFMTRKIHLWIFKRSSSNLNLINLIKDSQMILNRETNRFLQSHLVSSGSVTLSKHVIWALQRSKVFKYLSATDHALLVRVNIHNSMSKYSHFRNYAPPPNFYRKYAPPPFF